MDTKTARKLSGTIADIVANRPTVQTFINQVACLHPLLSDAVEGIWCGQNGTVQAEIGTTRLLVVQWYNGKVEVAYIS